MDDDEARGNALLAILDEEEYGRLRPMLQLVDAELRDPVYERRGPVTDVYFPLSAVYSMVAVADGVVVEVGTIGYEGMVGLPFFLGAATSPTAAFCQIPGRAVKLAAGDLQDFLLGDGQLHTALHRYTQTTMAQMAQNVVCNKTHTVDQRAARWLLTSGDRVRNDQFVLTQEFLGQMLGVTRPTVSETANKLRTEKLISYSRGHITLLDRPGLLRITCECYQIIKEEFDTISRHMP
ncbi:MAG: hypothetical protein QOI16_2938 [Pseudonocardiales bacterium]|jgi:CRP-like cAMP-binding protein|nr:hypothetical protein [Pseudonocardiales bacterium]